MVVELFSGGFQGGGVVSGTPLACLLFVGFSILVVHICQRLVEQTALAVGELERSAYFARNSFCIGALVWCLDALGLFLYRDMAPMGVRLAPTLFSLLIMVLASRITIPFLVSTRVKGRIVGAGVLLSLGMLAGHFVQISALGHPTGEIRWWAVGLACMLATGIAAGLALRHRTLRLRTHQGSFRPLSWGDKALAGVAILPLHLCLTASLPLLPSRTGEGMGGELPLLLSFVLFGVVVATYRMADMAEETRRRRVLNRAFSMVRSVRDLSSEADAQRLALIAERVEDLLKTDRIAMHYQPIVPVGIQARGIRFEALIRPSDPDLGSINPELLFLACERVGRTEWADRQVIQHALGKSMSWRQADFSCVGISVNVAPDTLLAEGFVPWLERELTTRGFPHDWLQLEITEHAMISSSDGLVEVLHNLLGIGVGVVMDDFGAGFSSLGVLVDLPLKTIKFDRALIANLQSDPDRQSMIRHLCAMARDLQVGVTVEGIETEGDLAMVKRQGADWGQGYFLARPMPADAVPGWLLAFRPNTEIQTTPATVPMTLEV